MKRPVASGCAGTFEGAMWLRIATKRRPSGCIAARPVAPHDGTAAPRDHGEGEPKGNAA